MEPLYTVYRYNRFMLTTVTENTLTVKIYRFCVLCIKYVYECIKYAYAMHKTTCNIWNICVYQKETNKNAWGYNAYVFVVYIFCTKPLIQSLSATNKLYIQVNTYEVEQEAHGPWRSTWEPTWPLTKAAEVAHTPSFYPMREGEGRLVSKLSLFSFYGQRFLRYGLIFKIAIFGHDSKRGHWPKFQKLHIISYYPRGSKLSLFSLYG